MKTKYIYMKPHIEVVSIQSEGIMASSDESTYNVNGEVSGGFGARERSNFWE